MRIAIIGAGHVGSALSRGCAHAGHDVVISAKDPMHAAELAHEVGVESAASNTEAASGADLVILAVPHGAAFEVAQEIAETGEPLVLVDVTNAATKDMSAVDSETSRAEELQRLVPAVRVVKAFNTMYASTMAAPEIDGVRLDGYFAGDDEDAKALLRALLVDLGYNPVDAGPLSMARALEYMGLLGIRLNALNGWGWNEGWKFLGAPQAS